MSEEQELRRFAELLIRLVRDRAIVACDGFVAGTVRGPRGERWRGYTKDASARHALTALIPDIVDQTLFELLNSIDQEELPLAWRRDDGSCVALEDLGKGEMAGWLMMGQEGWLDSFSQQRFFDPLADLDLALPDDSGTES
jgi:hypothetical protein